MKNGVSWKSSHGIYTIGSVEPSYPVTFEGINQAGLPVSGNPANADYPAGVYKETISSDDMVNYVPSQASNINVL